MSTTQPPVFIVGANRSGTTLLRLILNAHSDIAIPDELAYFDARFARDGSLDWRNPPFSRKKYEFFVHSFLARNRETLAPLSIEALEAEILDTPAPNLRRPYRIALERWAAAFNKTRWGEKTPGNLFYVNVMLAMFPTAQFIYLMRDPRAGVYSMNTTKLFSSDATINALNRRKYTRQGKHRFQQVVPAAQRLFVRYEDLVSRAEATVRQICGFLDVDYEPAMLSFYEDSERYMKKQAANQFNRSATKPISESKIDAWRGALTPAQVAVIERICRHEMEEHGYEPAAASPWLIPVLNVLIKTLYWKFQMWRHRHSPQYILQDAIFARTRHRIKTFFEQVLPDRKVHT